MGELASKAQLRMSFLRWAIVTVPLIVLLGFLSGQASNSGFENGWFAALARPDWFPPGWAFGVVWTLLYAAMGVALAMILDARGAKGRSAAIALFSGQLVLNLLWSPVFFAAHQVSLAFFLIVGILVMAALTARAFFAIRKPAGYLLVPYLAWLAFASVLNFEMDRLNPDAESFQPGNNGTEFVLPNVP